MFKTVLSTNTDQFVIDRVKSYLKGNGYKIKVIESDNNTDIQVFCSKFDLDFITDWTSKIAQTFVVYQQTKWDFTFDNTPDTDKLYLSPDRRYVATKLVAFFNPYSYGNTRLYSVFMENNQDYVNLGQFENPEIYGNIILMESNLQVNLK